MNKKAFTLIELLAILFIMAAIFAIVMPEIFRTLDSRKEKQFDALAETIENAARSYISDNYDIGVDTIPEYITLGDLINNNLLESPVIDPRTKEEFDSNTHITIIKDADGVLIYTFDDIQP